MELVDLTLSEAAEQVRQRKIGPVELVRAYLERCQRLDRQLNSYITLAPELALAAARQAQARLADGDTAPLLGMPLALKDLYDVQGLPTTAGARFRVSTIPATDATTVRRLKAAGVVLLGKLNMHELAFGVTNANPHFGPCRNPWDLERSPGGSSGGSAAALAARLCLGSLGSDTGGSIRIPASLCGVVGLKPTTGRVSLNGVVPLSWSLDHAGPLARRVRDAALLLQVIAGYDPDDPASVEAPVDDYLGELAAGVQGWRIGLAADAYFDPAEAETPEVYRAVRQAAQVFGELGAQVEEVSLPGAAEAARANGVIVHSEAAAYHLQRLKNSPQDFGADVRDRLNRGAAFSASDYALARRVQAVTRRAFEQILARYQVLLLPTTATTAPRLEGLEAVAAANLLTRYTGLFNLTGLPALSLPCGFTNARLPVGLQIVGRAWDEAAVLRAGYAYESATEWHLRQPDLVV
jgi:aspartyl-tRNA(Asn)/glutamyl-tRNA(Gln) amidotransferase subunit A